MATLVCGVGYIGAALAARLLAIGADVVGLDNLFSTDRRAIDALSRHERFRFVEGDVADPGDVASALDAADVSVAYLLAAQSSPNDAATSAEYTERANLRGPRVLLDACAERDVPAVILGSSLRVYGQPLPHAFDERTPYGPQRDLSHLTKIYAEKLLEMYAGRRPMRAVAARLAIVYGLGPVMKRDSSFMTVPNRFAWQARQGQTLRVDAGQGTVELIHLDDAVRSLIELGDGTTQGYQAVNVLGEELALAELARLVSAEAARRGLSVAIDLPAEPPPERVCGRSLLGRRPSRPLAQGLRELLDYFLADRVV